MGEFRGTAEKRIRGLDGEMYLMPFSERFGDDWDGGLESCCGIWLWLNFVVS